MRTKIFTIVLLILVGFSSCDKQSRERRQKLKPIEEESVESLARAVDAIDWNNHNADGADPDETNEPCYQNLMAMIRLMPKVKVDKDRLKDILEVYEFSRLIQEPIDAGHFGRIQGHDLRRDIFPFPIRDRILEKVDEGYSDSKFKSEVKGDGNLSDGDADLLGDLYSKFHDEIKNRPSILGSASRRIGNCIFTDLLLIRITGVQYENKTLQYRVKRQVTFVCDCGEESDRTQPMYGYVEFQSNLSASYEEHGLYNLVFGNATRPEITGLNVVCCPNNVEEEEEQEEEYQQHQEGGH